MGVLCCTHNVISEWTDAPTVIASDSSSAVASGLLVGPAVAHLPGDAPGFITHLLELLCLRLHVPCLCCIFSGTCQHAIIALYCIIALSQLKSKPVLTVVSGVTACVIQEPVLNRSLS